MKQKIIYGLVILLAFAASSLLFKNVILISGKGLEQTVGLFSLIVSYFGFRIIRNLSKQKALEE